ncbi:MAG TPA: ABC transporter permease [Geminicoccus sp.]|jgi:ribose/xylose/arabinose/galactoside ABC-type transport system permease subunit|uniref:ABC transporter permease n=1 Tax=Geminicoccus sp. TaxID=2024832 RepID=UPI002E366F46|nr:ABC transporter permease [Geminicoccus sp.]HEX2528643.1 ABC transporter permease [Geminicoccus sp.]
MSTLVGQARRHGFLVVLVLIFAFFSLVTPHFASGANLVAMLHTMAPVVLMSAGMALVVLAGKLDISIGSIAFLSSTFTVLLMNDLGVHPVIAFAAALVAGALLGALNGFIVVVLGINPLIATLGTMIAFRGVALQLTGAILIPLPESVRALGNLSIGPVFVDILIVALLVLVIDQVHRRTVFGRQVNAIGNGEEVAERIGIPVRKRLFLAFVLSGLLASIGGLIALVQVGSISAYLGRGMEFTAVAVVVVGGISLFGGRGNILPGVVLGALTFEMIENGLNQMSANPYAYRLVTGAIIFVAMYVDALKSGRLQSVRRVALGSS